MLTEHLAVIIEELGGGAVVATYDKIAAAATKAGIATREASVAATGQIRNDASAVEGLYTKVGTGLTAVQAAVLGAGAAAIGVGLIEFLKSGTENFIKFTDQARTFEQIAGTDAKASSELAMMFRELGVDIDMGATYLGRFGRNAVQHADQFAKLGVEIAHTKTGAVDVEATLLNTADRFQQVGGGAEGATIAMQLFGRGGAALIPVLAQGRDGLKEFAEEAKQMGLVFNQKQIDDGFKLKLSMTELKTSMEALTVSAVKPLADSFAQMGFGAVALIKDLGGLLGSASALGVVFRGVLMFATLGISEALFQAGEEGAASAKKLAEHSQAAAADAAAAREEAAAIEQSNNALQAQADAALALPAALLGDAIAMRQVDAQISDLTKSTDTLARAQQDRHRAVEDDIEAHRKYNELLADTGALTRELQRDERDLHSAELAAADAKQAQADAVAHLNHMMSVGAGPLELEKAQRGVDEANIKVEDSTLSVTDAAKKLHDAQTGESDTAKNLTAAKRGQEDADRRVVDSTHAVTTAIDAQKGKEDELVTLLLRKAQIAEDVRKRIAAANGKKPTPKEIVDAEIWSLKLLENEYPQFATTIENVIRALGIGQAAADTLNALLQPVPSGVAPIAPGIPADQRPSLQPAPGAAPGGYDPTAPGGNALPLAPSPRGTNGMGYTQVNVTAVTSSPQETANEIAWALRGAA